MSDVVIHRQKDRVSVSLGRTINVGRFESVRVDVSYASDVRKEEKLTETWDRVQKQAETKLEDLCGQSDEKPKKKKKPV